MKLNNKGFAITGILYTVFILFLMILLSVLGGLNIKRQQLEKNIENINKSLEEECMSLGISAIGYTTQYQGKYTIAITVDTKEYTYETYLPKGIKFDSIETIAGLGFIGMSEKPPINNTVTIEQICTTDRID